MPRTQRSKLLRYRLGRVRTTESRSWTTTIYWRVSQQRRGVVCKGHRPDENYARDIRAFLAGVESWGARYGAALIRAGPADLVLRSLRSRIVFALAYRAVLS